MSSGQGSEAATTRERVPAHLRKYVVEQNLAEYNELDQAVWRFVLLQLHYRLKDTAHPAYVQGLAAAGIAIDRIPSITAMDNLLNRSGWGAVCVDGFIPPLAFQEFQALGILPISANIRTLDHLVYTPAPDIIHEAAGHAPILSDKTYADYLRAIGQAGAYAFSSREDARVYQAIFTLSEVKENPSATSAQIQAAEAALSRAQSEVTWVSEATRLSRLYWWTAEYGLVGAPNDYRLYGAGLLSSLSESHFCHAQEVEKVPLSVACLDVPYDITRPQPQLFVAEDFDHLTSVLREAEESLAYTVGGRHALQMARASSELATLEFENGVGLTATVVDFDTSEEMRWVAVAGPGAWLVDGGLRARFGGAEKRVLPVGWPERIPEGIGERELVSTVCNNIRTVDLRWSGGIRCMGKLERCWLDTHGSVVGVTLSDYQLEVAEYGQCGARLDLGLLSRFRTARRGALSAHYYEASEYSHNRIPRPRTLPEAQQTLLKLYEQAIHVFRTELGGIAVGNFANIYQRLERDFPNEWLLRWNLLECLSKLQFEGKLKEDLLADLADLEVRFQHQQPVASGLRYLAREVGSRAPRRD
ncbi:MAG: aromatic amino acid hydroxylase [Polyangiaceae bacterium]|nr:aromatic amino acid hydroxylase [Polyangiaceae bacterium]